MAWRQFLLAVIRVPHVSARLIEQIVRLLLPHIKVAPEGADLTLNTLLSDISQRHPLPFRSATATYSRGQGFDDAAREEFEHLVTSLVCLF